MCGFEMFILHGGHGWLINQFLSPATNTRTDAYGGSTENRCRFPIMIIEEMRKVLPRGTPIDFRMSGSEFFEGGYDIEEECRIAKVLQDYVDMIHVSAGNHEILDHIVRTHHLCMLPHGANVYLAAEIKKHVTKVPVACVGGINDPAMAEEILASGKADAVCIRLATICDPEWSRKVKESREGDIRKCIRCLSCLNQVNLERASWCSLNMDIGEELKALSGPPALRPERKKVSPLLTTPASLGGLATACGLALSATRFRAAITPLWIFDSQKCHPNCTCCIAKPPEQGNRKIEAEWRNRNGAAPLFNWIRPWLYSQNT